MDPFDLIPTHYLIFYVNVVVVIVIMIFYICTCSVGGVNPELFNNDTVVDVSDLI